MKELVFFKGTKSGVQIILDDKEKFEEVFDRLKEKLKISSVFFVGSSISVNLGERKLSSVEYKRIENLLTEEYGLTFLGIEKEVKEETEHLEVEKTKEEISPVDVKVSEDDTLLIRKTIRSGQSISHHGNIVILGDLNPGAEVTAGGDIIVMGALRGTVHAGFPKNTQARIYALKFQTPNLRISEFVSNLEDKKIEGWEPQLAKIDKDRIIIKKLE